MGKCSILFEKLNPEGVKVILQSMEDGVVIQNANNEIIGFNPAALRILELQEDELLGKTSYDSSWQAIHEDFSICKPEEHPSVIAKRTLKICANHLMGVRAKGRPTKWVRVTAVPICDGKSLSYIVITFHDVSVEVEARAKMEEKKRHLRTTMDSVPALISYWNIYLENVNSNKAFSEFYKVKAKDIVGAKLANVIGQDLFDVDRDVIFKALGGKKQTVERDSKQYKAIVNYVPDIVDGEVRGLCVVESDITEIRLLEEQRREAEVRLLTSSRWAALGEMAGNIAHEINNPLAAIKLKTSLLQKWLEDEHVNLESVRSELKSVQRIVDKIGRIVGALNQIARDGEEDEACPASLKECIEEAIEIMKGRLESKDVKINLVCSQDVILLCRAVQIVQVAVNLIGNALDAVQDLDEKWITISVEKKNSASVVSFKDSGEGIASEIKDRLTAPFFTTKEPGRGVGLGLSISKNIMEKHGGKLFYDPVGGHTCFHILFPIGVIIS